MTENANRRYRDSVFSKYFRENISQSFMVKEENPALELKVDVYNINYREDSELLQKSKHLTANLSTL